MGIIWGQRSFTSTRRVLVFVEVLISRKIGKLNLENYGFGLSEDLFYWECQRKPQSEVIDKPNSIETWNKFDLLTEQI